MDSVDLVGINNEEDNFSDTDNEEQWEKESMLPVTTQTTYVWEKKNNTLFPVDLKILETIERLFGKPESYECATWLE